MAARNLEATERAMKTYRPGMNVRRHAAAHGIAYTTLYRALRNAKANGKGHK